MHTIRNLFPRLFLSRLGAGALGLIAVLPAGAAEKYVTPTGGGLFDGSNWANAFSNIQQAVNASPTRAMSSTFNTASTRTPSRSM